MILHKPLGVKNLINSNNSDYTTHKVSSQIQGSQFQKLLEVFQIIFLDNLPWKNKISTY